MDERLKKADAVSKALSDVFTGVALIDLTDDSYTLIKARDKAEELISGISSAQDALLFAAKNTVEPEYIQTMTEFLDLRTLPQRMATEHYIGRDYADSDLGWVRGSFIEAARDENGRLTQAVYAYRLINEEKRLEIEHKKALEESHRKSEQAGRYKELRGVLNSVSAILDNIAMLDNVTSKDELDAKLPSLLSSLGKYSRSDRAYIFSWASPERLAMRMTHEWCADGVRPTIDEMQDVRICDMPNQAKKLYNGEPMYFLDWDAAKDIMPEEYALFDGQDIHALIVIPIFANQSLSGYIGFDNPESSKSELSLRVLAAVSSHIGSIKGNLSMMENLEAKQESLQSSLNVLNNEKKILDALTTDYISFFFCDLTDDLVVSLKQENYINAAISEKTLTSGQYSYSFRIKDYFDKYVVKESAPDFVEKLSADYLMEYLSHNRRFAYRYRSYPNAAGQQYFEVQVVKLEDSQGFKTVMGFRYIDDIVAEQEKQKTQLENALAEAKLNSEIIGSIGKIYWLIYRLDIKSGMFEEISASQETHKLTGKAGNAQKVLDDACDVIVGREYREIMREFWDLSTLPDRMSDTDSIAVEYMTTAQTWNRARFIVKKRGDDGTIESVLYVVRKIDAEKRKELEYKHKLLETAEDARRANMAKTDFLRRMSHDIRTPINGIQGMIAIAEHFNDDINKQKECRQKIKEASGFLLDLVNSVLEMNKLESGALTLEHIPFDLSDVLSETCSIAEMNGTNRDLSISFDVDDLEHTHLIGSPLHLGQILQNITGNAIKYNRAGGSITLSARELSCENGKAEYRFICSDTGIGMSKEFVEHAFEPFAQEHSGARSKYVGTGLGLSITKQLVEMMGGTIKLESKLDVGSTFTVTIPFEVDHSYREERVVEEEIPDSVLSGKSILIAEDNELNMEIAVFMLEESGIRVTTARNGQEAVDIFAGSKENSFDIILMDIMMPVMDGLTAAEIIRSMDRADAKTVPIFAMTANAFKEDIERSKQAGMNEHLSKPLEADKMRSALKRYIAAKN